MNRVGRPLKYISFLQILDDDVLYSPASIALAGEEAGLFQPCHGMFEKELDAAEIKKAKVRVRHTLSALKRSHSFPITGDGLVMLKGHAPLIGWYGKRWKTTLK